MKNTLRELIIILKGEDVKKEYQEIQNIQNLHDMQKFQQKYLEKLILHTYKNVPYYQNIFDRINIVTNEKVNLTKFKEIPLLTKELLRKHQNELTSTDYQTRKWYYNSSGGSTGDPTRFIQDTIYKKWYSATNRYYYQELLQINENNARKIFLWGSPQDLFKGSVGFKNNLKNWFSNIRFLNSFKMTENDMKSYIHSINTYRPDLIRGYAGALYELALFSEKQNTKMFSPKKIVCSAETLTNDMRTKIESVFGTKVYDFYGSRETASIAGECKKGLIHIFSFNNYVERLDQNNNPVTEGEEGRVIITPLHNLSMPLIRYELGDVAILGLKECPCGNHLPTLRKISGRLEEQFIKKDGSIVIGYFFVHLFGVLLNKGFIKQFQVVQEDYDRIRIRAVLNKELPEPEKNEIEQKIRVTMGQDCTILWDYVDTISKTNSGKYLYTQSLVKR
ncbi:MAG: phenylacetate--CoA ligase family protein [Candidatus Thermoplasmatota archaeon]|nr:phenylacetate--CoA ligase family protein [Candidatus Thermoplasmatota archaeon]